MMWRIYLETRAVKHLAIYRLTLFALRDTCMVMRHCEVFNVVLAMM